MTRQMSAQPGRAAAPEKRMDYTLLLRQIGKALIHEGQEDRCRAVLDKQGIWAKLSPAQAMEWGELCQIAGLTETAVQIYQHLIRDDPGFEPAWKACISLLDILDDRSALAAVVARAGKVLPQGRVAEWIKNGPAGRPADQPAGFESAAGPFLAHQERERHLDHFMSLFAGRADAFARQWADRETGKAGYVPVRRPLERADLEDHFKGLKTYGFYLMDRDARVCCGVIDADLISRYRTGKNDREAVQAVKKEQVYMVARIKDMSAELGMQPLIEVSGFKGLHFWYFLDQFVPAGQVREILGHIVQGAAADLTCFDLEIFPKQDMLTGKGFGNLVKLPLGVHRLTGRRSYFPACTRRDIPSQLAFLSQIKPVPAEKACRSVGQALSQNVVLHPKAAEFAGKYPDLRTLSGVCRPLGEIISLARESGGLSARQEKILYQTVGFLPRAKALMHFLLARTGEYNSHLVDYKLSRVRGTPLGCRRIHSLTGYLGGYCELAPDGTGYIHPLIHLADWKKISEKKMTRCEKIDNLSDAVANLKAAVVTLEKYL